MNRLVKRLVVALCLAIGFRACVMESFIISGGSMIPAVIPGDVILTNKIYYGLRVPGSGSILIRFRDVKEGDIVLLSNVGEPPITIVRRVLGIAGDKIRVERGLVSKQVGGVWQPLICEEQEVAQEFCLERIHDKQILVRKSFGQNALQAQDPEKDPKKEFIVGENEVFVLADDRRDGPDSRHFGIVAQESIIGKVVYVWIPKTKFDFEFAADKILTTKIRDRAYFTKVN